MSWCSKCISFFVPVKRTTGLNWQRIAAIVGVTMTLGAAPVFVLIVEGPIVPAIVGYGTPIGPS